MDQLEPGIIDSISAAAWSLIATIESYNRLMTIEDVMEVLGLSKSTVYRMAQRKQIPSLVIGGARKFDPAALGTHFRKKSPESAAAVLSARNLA